MTLPTPSPHWIALQLGELLAGQSWPLTDPQRKALAFAFTTHHTAGTEWAQKLADYLDGAPLPQPDHEDLRRRLDVAIDGKQRAEARNERHLQQREEDAVQIDMLRVQVRRQRDELAEHVDQLGEALRQRDEAADDARMLKRTCQSLTEEMAFLKGEMAKMEAEMAGSLEVAVREAVDAVAGRRLADLNAATPGLVGADHPETSRTAADSVARSAKHERLRILASVIEDGPASASVIAARLGLVPNQVSARCLELRDQKWLEWREWWDPAKAKYAYLTGVTPSGQRGNLLFLTDSGRDELVREHGSLEVAAKLLREGRTS